MDNIDFSSSCIYLQRVMVDWKDLGVLELMDMDNIVCHSDVYSSQIVPIKLCVNCVHAALASEDDDNDERLSEWLRWSTLRGLHGKTKNNIAGYICSEDYEEREALVRELLE